MEIILIALACFPLLALESLRWHGKTGNQRILPKALRISFTASVSWALLGDYVASVYAGWNWFFYLLMAAGAAFTGCCAWKNYGRRSRTKRTFWVVVAFLMIFNLTAWLIPDSVWLELRDNVDAWGRISRLHIPLH